MRATPTDGDSRPLGEPVVGEIDQGTGTVRWLVAPDTDDPLLARTYERIRSWTPAGWTLATGEDHVTWPHDQE